MTITLSKDPKYPPIQSYCYCCSAHKPTAYKVYDGDYGYFPVCQECFDKLCPNYVAPPPTKKTKKSRKEVLE